MATRQTSTGARHWNRAGSVGGVRPAGARIGPAGMPSDGYGSMFPLRLPPYFGQAPLGYNALPYNTSSMETDVSGWSAVSGATIAQQSSPAYDGTHSLAVTCSAATSVVQCSPAHVWPGVVYYPQAQVLTTVAGVTAALQVDYLDGSGNVLASAAGPATPVPFGGVWGTVLGAASAAPAGSAQARVKVTVTSPGGGTVVSVDAVYLGAAQDPPAFTSNTYLSFDPPNTASPNFIDVTQFVEIEAATIGIQHGRQDGLSDVNNSSLALTVDNSDGRWFSTNPAGAWYGGLRKGVWIKQTHTFAGVERPRFVGFITGLPKSGLGAYQTVQVTGTDWLGKLGQNQALPPAVFSEHMTDPYGLPAPWAYYALSEQAANTVGTGQAGFVTTANDTSGYASQLGQAFPLVPRQLNTGGGAIQWAQSQGPGFDSEQAVSFAPVAPGGGSILPSGFTLYGQLARPLGASWLIRFWVNTSYTAQITNNVLTLADYSAGVQCEVFFQLSAGQFAINTQGSTAASSFNPLTTTIWTAAPVLSDGAWHLISVYAFPSPAGGGKTRVNVTFDGLPYSPVGDFNFPPTLQSLTLGGHDATLRLGAGNASLFTGALYGLSIVDMSGWPAGQYPSSSIAAVWQAGATGFAGETTGARLTRVARYAGVPPAWTNFATGVSQVGPQQYAGRYPLDVMREVSRTEAMPLYAATDGRITMQARTTRMNAVAAWTQQASDLAPDSGFTDDFSYIINQSQMTRVGGSQITVNGVRGIASQNKYGLYYTSQQTASIDDQTLVNLGQWLLLGTCDPPDRFQPTAEYATLSATGSPLAVAAGWGSALYQAVLAADLSTMFTIAGFTPQEAPSASLSQVIEGWTETITATTHTFAWSTTVPFASSIFQLDTGPYNQLDAGYVLGY